jgi:hypothetical protein
MAVETKVQLIEIEPTLVENGIYLVTSKGHKEDGEEDRGYIYNRKEGEHIFSRKMGYVHYMRQIHVDAKPGNLEVQGNRVWIIGSYLVGALSESTNPSEYRRLLEIWMEKRHDRQ